MVKSLQMILSTMLPSLTGKGWGRLFPGSVISVYLLLLYGCEREPELHLYDAAEVDYKLPLIDLELDVVWNYELFYGIDYDWQSEWYYGWDDNDRRIFGELGYTEPTVFNLRRYYTGSQAYGPHTNREAEKVYGHNYQGRFNWGFWDLLVWNDVQTLDGVQSLNFDEETSLEQVVAYTNETMVPARYHAPRFTRSFWEPEPLFADYLQAEEISPDLRGFVLDEERGVYVKTMNMTLQPITYIYLTQVILRHNNGRIAAIDGSSNLSGMARNVVVNTGVAGGDAVSVNYKTMLKHGCLFPKYAPDERADIVGGRVMTFGLCNTAASRVRAVTEVNDQQRHYMDVNMQFNNGLDSTFVFDVTDQVRRHFKGGVITVELDMDTIPIPTRRGGSGFDAVVEGFEEVTHEFEM